MSSPVSFDKKNWKDLAHYGGTALFKRPLHVGLPNIGDRAQLLGRINDILDRRWFTNDGPYVREFEHKIAQILGVRNCVAISNGTTALQIMIRACDLHGEVIVPSFTFVATAHALKWQNIAPVFADVGPTSHHLDPIHVEQLITEKTTAIIGVHTWGEPCDVNTLSSIAEKYRLKLLFDASHAFGCSYNGKFIGNFGLAEAFSFHATKYLNAFEGGVITTNDDSLAAKIRLMRNFGFSGYDTVVALGINGKMTEISAAMGITSLEARDDIVERNRMNWLCYGRCMGGVDGVHLLPQIEGEQRNYQYVVLEIDDTKVGIDRDTILKILHAEGILARRYFYPGCHKLAPYHRSIENLCQLPETESLCRRVLVLPTGNQLDEDTIEAACNIIRLAIQYSTEIVAHENIRTLS